MKKYFYLNENDELVSEMAAKPDAANRPIYDENKQHIGWEFLTNPTDKESPRVAVFFLGCEEIDQFVDEHKTLVEQLHQKLGNVKWTKDKCVKYHPRHKERRQYNDVDGYDNRDDVEIVPIKATQKGAGDNRKSESENIKRYGFLPTLRKFFGTTKAEMEEKYSSATVSNNEIQKLLHERIFPKIMVDSRKFSSVNKGHFKTTNEKIEYATTSLYTFKSFKEFKSIVAASLKDKLPADEMKLNSKYIARRHAAERRWSSGRKTSKSNFGVTPVYKLRKFGTEEIDYNIVLDGTLRIDGQKEGNSFIWTLSYVINMGNKKPHEVATKNMVRLEETTIQVNKTIQLEPGTVFDDQNTVVNDVSVMQGLNEVLEDFATKLRETPKSIMLQYARFDRSKVEKVDESKYQKLMGKLIRETLKSAK